MGKICPLSWAGMQLLSDGALEDCECLGDRCAWWCHDKDMIQGEMVDLGQCALTLIAGANEYIAQEKAEGR